MKFNNPKASIPNRIRTYIGNNYVFLLIKIGIVLLFFITNSDGWLAILILLLMLSFYFNIKKSKKDLIKTISIRGGEVAIQYLDRTKSKTIRYKEITEIIINQYYLPNYVTLKTKKQRGKKVSEKYYEIHFMDSEVWRKIAEQQKIQLSIIYKVEDWEIIMDMDVNIPYLILKSNQGIRLIDWEKYVENHTKLMKWEQNQYYNFKQLPGDLPIVHNFMLHTQKPHKPVLIQHYNNALVLSNVPREYYEEVQQLITTFNLQLYDYEDQELVYKNGTFKVRQN